ncbi:PREDICTED: uncharacterized protein LOC105556345 [Vollenhovia emeryi]|uniref:uncharacterized protein LOC105556345 n=1 Tax=Vollenhovia emeryi TaxID=411798 RepID=UPI0005F4B76A|nr:PREDICTED: uncharacterized protein LOC105556345 [Vollenhovia emeryi]
MPNPGFIVAEFSDGIQVILKTWLQNKVLCKYPSHYKTDSRIRKAIEKEETPTSVWSSFKVKRIFGEYPSLRKADEKAKLAIYTSDMDTDKEARCYRKIRAKKFVSSSESEEETCTDVILPFSPCPPKRKYTNKYIKFMIYEIRNSNIFYFLIDFNRFNNF